MSNRLKATVHVLQTVYQRASTNRLPFLAGSLAFHAFVSLLPALLLLLITASLLGGQDFTTAVIHLTRRYLSPSGQALLAEALQNASMRLRSSVLGLLVLLWSTYRIVWGLEVVFAELYGKPSQNAGRHHLRDTLVGFVALSFATVVVLISTTLFTLIPQLATFELVSPLVSLVGLTIAFFLIYYAFPPIPIAIHEALPGTIVAAVGWTVLQVLFHVYVTVTPVYDAYGVIGGVILLLLWLYSGAFILLLGIVINGVLTDRMQTTRSFSTLLRTKLRRFKSDDSTS
ncbi:YihY/virulence factor BrkB family protein [Haladaptatus halobius]|uniref:YihY/virulence factor BrkB family protein n=1 Tax=Haladaptatus halobius TaxID=2884875 RepID=UPI001D0A52E1|nr:YihY/virulence factor BrkB family protein [Haladaptatus halobius]